ncbi:MAG: OsmC family protein [Pseudomonadota bacterium]
MKFKEHPMEVEAFSVGRAAMVHKVDGHTITTDEPSSRGGTDIGPPPFNLHFATLAGCMHATMSLILADRNMVFDEVRIHLSTKLDPRGVFGMARNVRPISKIHKTVTIRSNATAEQIADIREQLEWRCMVSQLLLLAGVEMTEEWHLNGTEVASVIDAVAV